MILLEWKGVVTLNFDDIFRENYERILNFCYVKIGDKQLAEDCAQEVFLVLLKKMHSLKLDTNIAAWLYGAAKNEIKHCLRKNKQNDISLDDLAEIPQEEKENHGLFDEIVTEEEYHILENYYLNDEDISKLAVDKKLSVAAMYQRIHRIKQKIIKNSDKLHNILKK